MIYDIQSKNSHLEILRIHMLNLYTIKYFGNNPFLYYLNNTEKKKKKEETCSCILLCRKIMNLSSIRDY